MSKNSELLTKFFKEWLEWAESEDAALNNHHSFSIHYGLCAAWHNYVASIPGRKYGEFRDLIESFYGKENSIYPFGGKTKYDQDNYYGMMHVNQERLKFVRFQLKDTK